MLYRVGRLAFGDSGLSGFGVSECGVVGFLVVLLFKVLLGFRIPFFWLGLSWLKE